ncbi:DUF551 domain-containing protein [Lelliottia wanjuensis]|uniref:DUF551 domain-containing protein n=1 Tax=Lelliottia wanjuensis TaxID=3050585 RepID=UPI00254BC593|nr:DUF551 domain-containing protein [Lelliottia sp. V104_15]MDK9607087.1 DUF551 domain-containing protein [Lelliottia sp. V104_15]
MTNNKPTNDRLNVLATDLSACGIGCSGQEVQAMARELQRYRNAQQVVPSKPTESDIPSWLNGEKRLHWLSGAEWMHNTFCAAMQSGAVKDGWVACSERMPPEATMVLGRCDNDYDFVNLLGGELKIFCMGEWRVLPGAQVTHWQPLPAAPQQDPI